MIAVRYIVDRLKERSTWIGLTGVFSSLQYWFTDAQWDAVATAGVGIAGLISAFWPEKK